MATRALTRAERSELNRKRHAAKRAQLERQWQAEAEAKREAKRQAREENRAAWWRMRYGVIAPGQETKYDDLPEVPASSVERVTGDEWHVTGDDGLGYMVERTYRLTVPTGEAYEMPDAASCAELIAAAVDENLGSTQLKPGMSFGVWTVTKASGKRATVRDEHGTEHTLRVRYTADGRAYLKLYANSRAEKTVYADEMAA